MNTPTFCECCGATKRLLRHRPGQYRLCIPCFAICYDSCGELKTIDDLRAALTTIEVKK